MTVKLVLCASTPYGHADKMIPSDQSSTLDAFELSARLLTIGKSFSKSPQLSNVSNDPLSITLHRQGMII